MLTIRYSQNGACTLTLASSSEEHYAQTGLGHSHHLFGESLMVDLITARSGFEWGSEWHSWAVPPLWSALDAVCSSSGHGDGKFLYAEEKGEDMISMLRRILKIEQNKEQVTIWL